MPLSADKSRPDPGSLLAWQILAPITALFFVLVVVSGLAARQFFEPLTMQRDLARAEWYAKFSALVFNARLIDKTPQELIEEFREAGLHTLDFVSPDSIPAWTSPRFLAAGPLVEAWSVVTSTDGSPRGAITLRRQADAVVFLRQAIRAFALAACLTYAFLFAFAWFLLKRRVTNRLRNLMHEVGPEAATPEPGSDVVEQTRITVAESIARVREEASPMQRLLDGHTEMACTSSKDGTLLAINRAYRNFFGKTPEQLVGTNYLDLIPPTDRTEALASVQKLSRANPVNFSEHRVLLADGSIRWTRWRDTAAFDDGGNVTEVLSFGSDITAEKELAESIEGLRVAFDQMQSLAETGSLTWNFAADTMTWTAETRRLLGVDASAPASLEGLLAVVATDDLETVRGLFREAKERGRNFQHEFRAILPDGSLRVLQSRAEVLADPKTKLLNHLTCTLRDITALRDAEAATKRELRFREAVESSLAVGIVVRDMKGCTLSANPAFTKMVGFSEQELIAAVPPEEPYWPKDQRETIESALAQALAGTTPKEGFQFVFNRKDQTRFDALVAVAPVRDGQGLPCALLGAVTDISSILQTQRELRATNDRLRIAQDVAEFGIWDWDPVNDTLHWDRQSFALFGYPDAADPKEVWGKVHSEEEQERLTYKLKRLIAKGGTSGQDCLRVQWPDGSIHDILSTYVIFHGEAGHSTRVFGINRDVTAELEEERELHNAQERLAAALEGAEFGTFEHIIGLGDVNWSPANYEINGIDPAVTNPAELFEAWKRVTGEFFPQLMARMSTLPVDENHLSYEFIVRPEGQEPRRVRTSVFIERNQHGHPVRLVGITRRLD
jgi:PAS domain S-box-containing protein